MTNEFSHYAIFKTAILCMAVFCMYRICVCMYVSVSDDNRFPVVQIQLCTVQAAKRTSVQFCTTDWAMRI